ncbi:MAG: porin family protein [Brumimicrobium sp.]
MKKLLIMMLATSMVAGINAQEAAEKNVLAGLTLGTGMNFNTPQTNAISSNVGADFYAGMALDWHFAKNIAISTGLEFDFNRFRHTFNNEKGNTYFDYNDKEIVQRGNHDEENFATNTGEGSFQLQERRYRNIYLSLPVMLRFQTNYMGYLRYFGKFGVRNSFLLTTRTDNYGPSDVELLDMQNPGDMAIYKGSAGLSIGAEWNFTGSTCIVGELGYYYGFTEIHQQSALTGDENKNKSLYLGDPETPKIDRGYYSPSAKQGQLILKVSFLF